MSILAFGVWWLWFLLGRFRLPKLEKVIKSGWLNSFQFDNSDLLVWWLWLLLDRFWLPKLEKVIKFGWFKPFQFDNSDLLVWWLWLLLDGFWLPKIEKSNQVWLIQFISISIFLIFWIGDFDSFLTGFGCQRLKKLSTLADSIHFNSIILIFWFGDFDYFWTGFGCQNLKK